MTTPTLGYDNPAVFFAGVYRHRSRDTLVAAGAFTLLSVVAGYMAVAGPVPGLFRLPVGGLAAGLLLLAAYLAVMAALDREEAVRVTENGITYGRYFWPWDRIASFGGVTQRDGVRLEFRSTVAGAVRLRRPLSTTPPLTPDQFARLAAAVGAHVSRHHPHVTVDPAPRPPD